jgi:hypothetical protein
MSDTDLTLIDMDPEGPLDFYLDHYWDQLAAGYSKITHAFGVYPHCRDYNQLTPAQNRGKNYPITFFREILFVYYVPSLINPSAANVPCGQLYQG